MICHGFKGGIGTASRVLDATQGGWTVGVLVQANYGSRPWLRIDGVPVGEAISASQAKGVSLVGPRSASPLRACGRTSRLRGSIGVPGRVRPSRNPYSTKCW